MRLALENPYGADWKKGYLVVAPSGRRTVILFNSATDRSSVSYARYLVSVSLGRYLLPSEHVDHRDGDRTNDTRSNLQILSQRENNAKAARGRTMVHLTCPICSAAFSREARQVMCKRSRVTCSRRCGGKQSHITRSKPQKATDTHG